MAWRGEVADSKSRRLSRVKCGCLNALTVLPGKRIYFCLRSASLRKKTTMRKYRFRQIDSFSRERYLGNPAAVVFDADSLTGDEMQIIARMRRASPM